MRESRGVVGFSRGGGGGGGREREKIQFYFHEPLIELSISVQY